MNPTCGATLGRPPERSQINSPKISGTDTRKYSTRSFWWRDSPSDSVRIPRKNLSSKNVFSGWTLGCPIWEWMITQARLSDWVQCYVAHNPMISDSQFRGTQKWGYALLFPRMRRDNSWNKPKCKNSHYGWETTLTKRHKLLTFRHDDRTRDHRSLARLPKWEDVKGWYGRIIFFIRWCIIVYLPRNRKRVNEIDVRGSSISCIFGVNMLGWFVWILNSNRNFFNSCVSRYEKILRIYTLRVASIPLFVWRAVMLNRSQIFEL